MVRLEKPSYDSIIGVADSLRKIDRKECFLATGQPQASVTLIESVRNSSYCRAAWDHEAGLPLALFGVTTVPSAPAIGIPWMVGTVYLKDYRKDIIRIGPEMVEKFQEDHSLLVNFCLPENEVSIRWLKRLGFQFEDEPQPYGYFDHPFIKFWRTTDV